jgi:membrane fusion protein (multidrug efflux system)
MATDQDSSKDEDARPEGEDASKSDKPKDDSQSAKSGDDKKGDGDKKEGDDKPKDKKKGLLQRPILLTSMIVVVLVLAIAGLLWWLHARNFESTDDAFIDTHIVRLAPQTSGRVTAVYVGDNALVQEGHPIIDIDSSSVRTQVAQAEAQRAQAQAGVENARAQIVVGEADYRQSLSDLAAAEAVAVKAAQDLARYRALLAINPQAVAPQQLDQAEATARQTAAQRDSARKLTRTRLDQIAASRTQVASNQDQVKAADAQLQQANVNLGYNHLVAPVTGHITQKTVAVGNYVQAGTQLLAIVPLNLWVTANFKETQLALMRPGQPVTLKVDACPGSTITGKVDSIQRGAGQAFGILPPENATGNYVKVVQRVPVKIVLDRYPHECPLGPGLSVSPRVRVRN